MTESISICICTYKRPQMLNLLLSKLSSLRTEDLFHLEIVIVDNDARQSAKQVVETHATGKLIKTSYHVEPIQNISLARNRAIENSCGGLIALIDDDEIPADDWLVNLYRTLNDCKADGILGPVLPHFAQNPPEWVLKGRFFDRPTHETGSVLDWTKTRTGNALLRSSVFGKGEMWFDPKLGSGGEDRDLFKRKIAEGYIFRWCNEAPVYECIPPERWNKSILLKRALLRGKMALYSEAEGKPSGILKSTLACILYTLGLPVFFLMGEHFFMRYLIKNCDHLGKILAFARIDLLKQKYIRS